MSGPERAVVVAGFLSLEKRKGMFFQIYKGETEAECV